MSLPEVAQAVPAARWLVVFVLIYLAARAPSAAPILLAGAGVGAAILYALALYVFAARYPDRAEAAARWALPGDTLLLWLGMQITTSPLEFLLLGFPLTAVAGLLVGHAGAAAVAAALTLMQLPLAPASVFAPANWVGWGLAGFSLFATGHAGGAAFRRLIARLGFARALAQIRSGTALGGPLAANAALGTILAHFHASGGSLALVDPRTRRLEVLAAHGPDPYSRPPDTPQDIAEWAPRGGQGVLLTPVAEVSMGADRRELGSSARVPLVVNGTPVGLLTLHRSPGTTAFTRDDLEAAELMTQATAGYLLHVQGEQQLAVTLDHLAGGHAKVGYALTRDPVTLWPALLDLVRVLTSARFAVLALEHEDTGNIEIVSAQGLSAAAARDLLSPLLAAITRGVIQVTDASDTPAPLPTVTCVPLMTGTRAIGALGLGFAGGAPLSHPFLLGVAAHIAAAVDTARTAHRVADIGATEERRRIAREMHDGLAQTLANALLQVDLSAMTAQSAPAQTGKELEELRSLLGQAMRELREFMIELRRTDSKEARFFLALEALARELERRHRLSVGVVATGDDAHLPPAVRHALLAIARQALGNIQAHADATVVTVRAEITEEQCTLSIADDGIGFDVQATRAQTSTGHHLGLPSMEERASLVGGQIQIDSAPNHGTTVTVRVPLGVSHA